MAQTGTKAALSVSLHTEAKSIQDWEAVCNHVCDRAESMVTEGKHFGKLFAALMKTYEKYRDMLEEMRGAIATNKDYIDVPDYHETAIFQGFEKIIQCLNVMLKCYSDLFTDLQTSNEEITKMNEEIAKFSEKIIPKTNSEKKFYLEKEHQLQHIMKIYMKAAESNHPAFFIIARRYRVQLLQFQHIVKKSTDSMHDIIDEVQVKERVKRDFEIAKQKQFVENILTIQTQIKNVFNAAMHDIKQLSGKESWDVLVDKLGIYKVSGNLIHGGDNLDDADEAGAGHGNSNKRKLTIFDEPVPNTAGALIRSWLQRDMEMSAFIDAGGIGSNLYMIVTRWGFVQMFKHKDDISAVQEFYLYDYDVDFKYTRAVDGKEIKQIHLCVRQHRTFAPLKNVESKYQITFRSQEACAKFVQLLKQFQASHAPQT